MINLKRDEMNNSRLAASQNYCDNGFPLHRHDFFEIEYILEGSGFYTVNGIRYEAAPGTLFLMSPADIHGMEEKSVTLINIMFLCLPHEDEVLCGLIMNRRSPAFRPTGASAELIRLLALNVVEAAGAGKEEDALLYLNCLLHKLLSEENIPTPDIQKYIRKAVLYILVNFTHDLCLEDVARHVGLSGVYFSDLFSREMGQSYKKYLDGLRFDYAKHLLSCTDIPVSDILTECGFTDYANFSRRFKAHTGQSASAYRKQHT